MQFLSSPQSKTFTGPIAGGLRAGQALFFQGVVPTDAKNFAINLMLENREDIAFHFNSRIETSSVVCDSCQLLLTTVFCMVIFYLISFSVIVNGHFFCEFQRRDPLEKVKDLNINGDVFMNHFGICEVDQIKISVTLPAHKGN
ncbi:galectin-7-like [Astyanax mexicanus]|uniref:Galectin n=1 Tax=Astyanax mexicanus TaxID=7994 RepID=A0A8T2KZW5_ASTMX|nr:galectin-7-like [Astyanax mexicanus]